MRRASAAVMSERGLESPLPQDAACHSAAICDTGDVMGGAARSEGARHTPAQACKCYARVLCALVYGGVLVSTRAMNSLT
eukprot:1315108-Pyramimonas_sp.AAC.1